MSSFFTPVIGDTCRSQLANFDVLRGANSDFYSQQTKESVFNFTGASSYPPSGSNLTFSEKHKLKPPEVTESDVPPRKVRINEAMISSHFAEMRLTGVDMASTSTAPPMVMTDLSCIPYSTAYGADCDVPVESPDEMEKYNGEIQSVRLSKCLKDHLKKYPVNCPEQDVMTHIWTPQRTLALVPYNPDAVPPLFREKLNAHSEAPDSDEESEPLVAMETTEW
ncbi:unnamed protein product [Dicrocoelium dendriticum]|nr:unnamed protein product [Dicrocoelium dendriticum]